MGMTNAELTKKLLEQKQNYKELESSSKKEIQQLKRENMALKKASLLTGGGIEDKHKEVLRLSAFGYAPGNIHQILTKQKSIEISLEETQMIVDKIDLMPKDLYRFYLESKQDFKDKVSIDSGFFKSSIYKKYLLLETVASAGLAKAQEMDDDNNILKYTDQLLKLYEKMSNTFFKNGVDMTGDQSVEDLMGDYEKNKESTSGNIIKFDPSKIKVVG